MNYVFFGSPRFAAIILKRLIDADMAPAALVCNPDRPVGRKQIITPPATKQVLADERSSRVMVLQPEKLDEAFIAQLRALKPDFFIVAAYAKIIPQAVLDIPRLGTLGTHPSLLPKYRGASPLQSVLLDGELQTGTTIYAMDAKMDHGAIYAQKTYTRTGAENYLALEEALANLSADELIDLLPSFYEGNAHATEQDETLATFTKKFSTSDGFVSDEDLTAAQQSDPAKARAIFQKICALNPEPGCWTTNRDGKRIKLLEAKIDEATKLLKVTVIQIEGEKAKQVK